MAQTFATSPLVIYNTLSTNASFLSLLGTYTFTGGSTSKSFAIVTPGKSLPGLSSVTGVECIIHDIGDVRRTNYISDNSSLLRTWKIFLIAWDPATGNNINSVADIILSTFGGSTSIETVATSTGLQARVQTLILVPQEGAINPNP